MADIPGVSQLQLTPRDYYISTHQNLLRVRRSSGERTMSLENAFVLRLVVDEHALYYADLHGLLRVEHDAATPASIVDVEDVEGLDGIAGFALDSEFVYFTPFQEPGIFRVPKTGGAIEKLSDQKRPGSIALSETHVYFASFFRNRIGRLAKSGGRTETLLAPAPGPVALAVEGPLVIALMETSGDVMAIDTSSRKRSKLAEAGRNPVRLLSSEGDLYWSTGKLGPDDRTHIRRVAVTGGPAETLVSDDGPLVLLHVEAGRLYFSPTREASILSLDVSRAPDESTSDQTRS